MTVTELKEQYETLKIQFANINTAISALIGKNKIYRYSNIEATHMAETHSLPDLMNMRDSTWKLLQSIENQLGGSFVKLTNY